MPKRLRLSLILRRSVTGGFWSFSSRFTTRPRAIARATTSGSSYRSAIFYTSDEQKRIAEDTIADVDASGLWPGVTEVVPAGDFWEASVDFEKGIVWIKWIGTHSEYDKINVREVKYEKS